MRSAFTEAGLPLAGVLMYDDDLAAADRSGNVLLTDVLEAVAATVAAVVGAVDSARRAA